MWKPPRLPYYVAPDQLPAPLPTTQEIRASNDIVNQRSAQIVKAMGVHFVVKYGPGTKILEGNNMIFLRQHLPSLPIPRLWAMYEEDEDVFIIMERCEGDTLQNLWPALQASEKSAITKQLRSTMDQLRAFKPPESSFYGSLEGGPIPYFLFSSIESNPKITGPFVNEHDFIQGLVWNLRSIDELNHRKSYKTDFYEQNLPSCFRLGRPTLTHGDIQRKNIMVQRTGLQGDGCEPSFKLMIIDWEDSGWYPAYWEFFVMFTSFRWDDDWASRVQDFVVPWPAEAAALSMIYHDLFF